MQIIRAPKSCYVSAVWRIVSLLDYQKELRANLSGVSNDSNLQTCFFLKCFFDFLKCSLRLGPPFLSGPLRLFLESFLRKKVIIWLIMGYESIHMAYRPNKKHKKSKVFGFNCLLIPCTFKPIARTPFCKFLSPRASRWFQGKLHLSDTTQRSLRPISSLLVRLSRHSLLLTPLIRLVCCL